LWPGSRIPQGRSNDRSGQLTSSVNVTLWLEVELPDFALPVTVSM